MNKLATGLVVVSMIALAGAASAGSNTVGFDVGMAIPVSDLGDGFDQDLAFAGYATVPFLGHLALRGEVGQNRVKLGDEFQALCDVAAVNCTGDAKFTNFSGGLQYGGSGDNGAMGMSGLRMLPYVFATIGAYKTDGSLAVEADRASGSSTYLGLGLGAGLNIRVGENWGLQGDVHIHAVRSKDDDSADVLNWAKFVTPSAGIWFQF